MKDIVLIVREGMTEAPNKRLSQRLAALEMVRSALGDDEVVIGHDADGLPRLVGNQLTISISHSQHVIGMVLSEYQSVGLDIEFPAPKLKRVYERVLTEQERRVGHIAGSPDLANVELAVWTAKEAVVKASLHKGILMTDIDIAQDLGSATAFGRSYSLHYSRWEGDADEKGRIPMICVAVANNDPEN